MAKKHEEAFEYFKASSGTLSNADIAEIVEASESTVRKWKSRYKWMEKLGVEKSVTSSKKQTVTKKEPDIREAQRKLIIDALTEAGTYSLAFDLLIEIYLDAYMEYLQLKQEGMVEEKNRKEIARLLGQLGLDGRNKELVKKSGVPKGDEGNKKSNESEQQPTVSRLDDFRQRRKRS